MRCLFQLSLFTLAHLALLAAAAGAGPHCNASSLALSVPANASSVVPPANTTLIQVTLGFGTQNYTCQSGKFVNVGAVAEVFDISCLQSLPPIASALAPSALALSTAANASTVDLLTLITTVARMSGYQLANHYFDSSTGALSPVFNFAVSGGSYFVGKKAVDIPAPTGTQDVDWLLLQNVRGSAAVYVVREETAGGQPPTSCTVENEALQVPYAAKYWFYQ